MEEHWKRALGRRVRRLRRMRGLTQYRLGERVGLHMNYISDLELGKRNPSFITLCRLAKGLRVKVRDLTEEIDRELERESLSELGLRSPEEEAIAYLQEVVEILELEGSEALGDEERRQVYRLVKQALKVLEGFAGQAKAKQGD